MDFKAPAVPLLDYDWFLYLARWLVGSSKYIKQTYADTNSNWPEAIRLAIYKDDRDYQRLARAGFKLAGVTAFKFSVLLHSVILPPCNAISQAIV